MTTKICIYGMGVIGRELFRQIWVHYKNVYDVVMLCDRNITAADLAYLLRYDSVYHEYASFFTGVNEILVVDDTTISVSGHEFRLYSDLPVDLPLADLKVDVVFDCTGSINNAQTAAGFTAAGAKKVVACYPYKDATPIIVYGVNEATITEDINYVSLAEVETQVSANVLGLINANLDVEKAVCKAFTSYTNAQHTIDSLSSPNFEEGRAGAWNIVPYYVSSANAYKHISKAIPELGGRVMGKSYRAPVIDGGIMDITVLSSKPHDIIEIQGAIKAGAGTYQYVLTEDPIVSSDALGLEDFTVVLSSLQLLDDYFYTFTVIYDSIRGQCLQAIKLVRDLCGDGGAWNGI